VTDHLQTDTQIIRIEAEGIIPDLLKNAQDVYNFQASLSATIVVHVY
jgi:hypothetical protein